MKIRTIFTVLLTATKKQSFFVNLSQIPTFFSKSPERRRAVEVNVLAVLQQTKMNCSQNLKVNDTDRYGLSAIARLN